jgi:hypothetical protein
MPCRVLTDESWHGRRWVVETDIASCFESIPHDLASARHDGHVSGRGVHAPNTVGSFCFEGHDGLLAGGTWPVMAGRVSAGPVGVAPRGFVPAAGQAAILAGCWPGSNWGVGPADRGVAGGLGCQHGADGRVADRAVAGGWACSDWMSAEAEPCVPGRARDWVIRQVWSAWPSAKWGRGAAGLEELDAGAVADGEVAEGLGDVAFPDADRAVEDH